MRNGIPLSWSAVVLGAAAAATIPPQQQPHLATIDAPATEVYQPENASTPAPEELTDNATNSQADANQPTATDPPSDFLSNRTSENLEEPLTEFIQEVHTQAELQTVDGDPSSQVVAVETSYDAPPSSDYLVVDETPLVEPVAVEAAVSPQPPLSDNVQDASPPSTGAPSTTSAGPLEPLNLPSGASFMLGIISTTFSCLNRPYGYYADPDIHCRVYHVCNPSLFPDGSIRIQQHR